MNAPKYAVWLFVAIIIAFFAIGYAYASYDTVKIRCLTLTGHGEVRIYIGDNTYLINIDCPATTL